MARYPLTLLLIQWTENEYLYTESTVRSNWHISNASLAPSNTCSQGCIACVEEGILLSHSLLPLFPQLATLLLLIRCPNVKPQSVCIKIQLVLSPSLLQDSCDISSILDLPQIHVASALLDRVTNQLRRPGFTLCSHNCCLFLLTSFVDHKCRSLRFLLRYLFGFDSCGELGGKGEMLDDLVNTSGHP